MPYKVEIPPSVKAYLRDLHGLSRTGRLKLSAYIHGVIAQTTDDYRNDVANRLEQGKPYLLYQHVLQDEDGRAHLFDFVVSDAHAVYGVLRIAYAEHRPGGIL